MEPTFRASMSWLHTWAGVALGGVLFAIFWMGTLSVFDREIDLWMKPATRVDGSRPIAADNLARELQPIVSNAVQWFAFLPTEREPAIRIGYRGASGPLMRRTADPATMALLPEDGTFAATRFILPFHYNLHIQLWSLGYWIVGLEAMFMMALCVSGVVIHRKIFTDFFTFRSHRKPRRLLLDLHNVAGVLGLPFHFLITLSGLIIFFSMYFPMTTDLAYGGDRMTFKQDAFGNFSRTKANAPGGTPTSLDKLLADASDRWDGGKPYFLRVWHPGDANSYVEIRRSFDDSVTLVLDALFFDAASGELLHSSSIAPMMHVQRFISGLHFIQFRHWTLRWIYFGLGLVGCVVIATGYLFWLETRRRKHAQLGLRGVTIVKGLTVGSVTGILIATLAFFVANRLLPSGMTLLGQDRAALEIWTFYLVWLATFVHAWLRPVGAWRQQCWIIAALAVVGVLLNCITTGDHLVRALGHRHLWPIAGMDVMLLIGATIAVVAAVSLSRARP